MRLLLLYVLCRARPILAYFRNVYAHAWKVHGKYSVNNYSHRLCATGTSSGYNRGYFCIRDLSVVHLVFSTFRSVPGVFPIPRIRLGNILERELISFYNESLRPYRGLLAD